jgi:hypothetical protein
VVTGVNLTSARARARRGHVSVGRGCTVPGGPGAAATVAAIPPHTGVTARVREINQPPRGVPGAGAAFAVATGVNRT